MRTLSSASLSVLCGSKLIEVRRMVKEPLLAMVLAAWTAMFAAVAAPARAAESSLSAVIAEVQPKIVKIFGAGGLRGLEAYQSGMLISPEGHVLTAFSYVLDTDYITAVLDDGRKFEARLLGADPALEVAVLKIDGKQLPCFELQQAATARAGERILAFSNVFGVAMGDEPASVQQGVVSVATTLAARRGVYETPYHGPVYVIDAVTNNVGAAGGALVTRRGELLGLLGKQLRNALNNTWLSYAVPIDALRKSVDDIRAGKFVAARSAEEKKPDRPLTLALLGVVLVPDVLPRTPPYVDQVFLGSPAAESGLRPDDLIVLLGNRLIQSCKSLGNELQYVDQDDPLRLTVLRGHELLELTLPATQR